jgi:hypothetical protein
MIVPYVDVTIWQYVCVDRLEPTDCRCQMPFPTDRFLTVHTQICTTKGSPAIPRTIEVVWVDCRSGSKRTPFLQPNSAPPRVVPLKGPDPLAVRIVPRPTVDPDLVDQEGAAARGHDLNEQKRRRCTPPYYDHMAICS